MKPTVPPAKIATTVATTAAIRLRSKPSTALVSSSQMDDRPERQLNIHLDPEHLAGVYANFANITFSDYEFTLTFARVDHEVEEGEVPGVVVSRVNLSPRFMRELIDAMEDNFSKWQTREGIRDLPEFGPGEGPPPEE